MLAVVLVKTHRLFSHLLHQSAFLRLDAGRRRRQRLGAVKMRSRACVGLIDTVAAAGGSQVEIRRCRCLVAQ